MIQDEWNGRRYEPAGKSRLRADDEKEIKTIILN